MSGILPSIDRVNFKKLYLMNSEMNSNSVGGGLMQYASYEAQFAAAISHLGYAPQLTMKGVEPKPNSAMPWATVGASKINSVDGRSPMRVESQLEFHLHQNVLSCSDAQKMAIAMEMTKDVIDVISAAKDFQGVVEVTAISVAQPQYVTKPSEQVIVVATVKILSNYYVQNVNI